MKFDEHGHLLWTPKILYDLAKIDPGRLVNRYLMFGTPWAFPDYDCYCAFLEAVAERTAVHPRNLYLRGSCQIGFSIAPERDRVWVKMQNDPTPSDLDLVIVDEGYFNRVERELRWWEERNPYEVLADEEHREKAEKGFRRRQRDRYFNCCRDTGLSAAVCVHHQDTMRQVAEMKHSGLHRRVSAFIYPDWFSARQRYEFDLRELVKGVERGDLDLERPGDELLPAEV
jgi:hypothetical protein